MDRYGVILADIPWQFKTYSAKGMERSPDYPTLTLEALKNLDLQQAMLPDCAFFMWVTWPTITQAFELAESWGLTYKTCAFLWAKLNKKWYTRLPAPLTDPVYWFMGLGYWSRANTEPCLLFTKGSPKRLSAGVRQLIVSPVERHSKKPDAQYTRIEQLVDGPYLELFARQPREGWSSVGNEIDGRDIRDIF